jgi:hypothetical protein
MQNPQHIDNFTRGSSWGNGGKSSCNVCELPYTPKGQALLEINKCGKRRVQDLKKAWLPQELNP